LAKNEDLFLILDELPAYSPKSSVLQNSL